MKKIAIVTMGVKLGNEKKGYPRFRFLANLLVSQGYAVDLITSSFQHWEKAQRDTEHFEKAADEHYNIVFIKEPGYDKNVDIKRILSHSAAAKNLRKYFEEHHDYDLVYAEIPPNNVALVAGKFAQRINVPFVTDVNDLWPEAMRMAFDVPVLSSVLFSSFSRDARDAYKLTSAVVGTSEEYAARPFKDRPEDIPHRVVYVGTDLENFDEGVARFTSYIEKPADEFWVTYAGTLGSSYDIATLIQAVDELKQRGYEDIRAKILGSGPTEGDLRHLAEVLDAPVDFIGYLPYQKMAVYLRKSDVVVNSFVKKAPQSIVNKIGDYFASGHPMINTCSSEELREKVERQELGINVEAEDPEVLAAAILALYDDPALRQEMGLNARTVAEEEFDRPRSYRRIVELIGELLTDK